MSYFSLTNPSSSFAEGELTIAQEAGDIVLTWPGEERLFSSEDLSSWTEVSGARSPFRRAVTERPQEFFELRPPVTPTQISLAENATVGTRSIPVSGTISSELSGTEGLRVEVSGFDAEIITQEGALDTFQLNGLALQNGANEITVELSNSAGERETITLNVNFDLLSANNIVIHNSHAFAALGTAGLGILDLTTSERFILNASAVGSVHDLSIDGNLLFTLDATSQQLSVFSLTDPTSPQRTAGPVSAQNSVFSGVSAGAGRVVVSGGTRLLSVYTYTDSGTLGTSVSTIDLGIGQPDVIIAEDGSRAFVSTDFSSSVNGQRFGITGIGLNAPPTAPDIDFRVGLSGAGFSAGARQPANFPIESALLGDRLLVAHGSGLAIINTTSETLERVVNVGFSAINVDVSGDQAFIIGTDAVGNQRLAQVDLTSISSPQIANSQTFTEDSFAFSGVAASENFIVIAANGGGLQVIPRN